MTPAFTFQVCRIVRGMPVVIIIGPAMNPLKPAEYPPQVRKKILIESPAPMFMIRYILTYSDCIATKRTTL